MRQYPALLHVLVLIFSLTATFGVFIFRNFRGSPEARLPVYRTGFILNLWLLVMVWTTEYHYIAQNTLAMMTAGALLAGTILHGLMWLGASRKAKGKLPTGADQQARV